MVTCYLGIGSNLGNRKKNIDSAIKKISSLKGTDIIKKSRLYKFPPTGGPSGQPDFLNAALKVKTELTPANLLKKLKKIERELGRTDKRRFWPRPIDIDILLYGNRVIKSKTLSVPHPRMFKRDFVIRPLSDIL